MAAMWKSLNHGRLFMNSWATQFMKFSGQSTGVGSLSLLQGLFPFQGSNPGLLLCRQVFSPTELPGKPKYSRLSISWRIHEPELDDSHINGHYVHFKPKKLPVFQSSYPFAHVLYPWAIKNESSCHYTLLMLFPLCPRDSVSSRYLILYRKENF